MKRTVTVCASSVFLSSFRNTSFNQSVCVCSWDCFLNYTCYMLLYCYHRFQWYATLENETPAEMFPKFPSVLRVIDRSGQNPPITATSVTFRPSLCHASGLWLVDFDPICQEHVWLTEILETFPRVFCFRKSRINENGGNNFYNFMSSFSSKFIKNMLLHAIFSSFLSVFVNLFFSWYTVLYASLDD